MWGVLCNYVNNCVPHKTFNVFFYSYLLGFMIFCVFSGLYSVTIHFNVQIVLHLANEDSFMLAAVSLFPSFFEHVFTFCHRNMFWAYIVLFLPNPGIHFQSHCSCLILESISKAISLGNPGSFYWRMTFRS